MPGFLHKLTNLFALWVVLGTAWAFVRPDDYGWWNSALYNPPALGLIMLGMGITLTLGDFKDVLRMPGGIAIGVAGQFLIMPLAGFAIAKVFQLPRELALGLILVSCCPGGTASNVVAFLGRANLALSVLMTMTSTLLAVFLTPSLTWLLAREQVPVDPWDLFVKMVMIVLLPLAAGVLLNQLWPSLTRRLRPVSPLVSVVLIVLIVGAIVAKSRDAILGNTGSVLVAVLLLHLVGFGVGYWFARILGRDRRDCRTVSIEVGMQNSGLGATLARSEQFATYALAPVPSAISAVYHCLIGSFLASLWRCLSEKAGGPGPEK